MNDFLKTEPAGSVTIEEAEEFGKYAEEYGTMCYSQHKIVASNGKKLLSLLQGKKSLPTCLPSFTPVARLLPRFLPPRMFSLSMKNEFINLNI